ncbi:MAG: DUF4920 domain-containing protein [Myxococcaceae bacterium]
MKTLTALTVSLLLAVPAFAADQSFGKKLSDAKAVKLSELLAKPADYVGKTVKVEGLITDVCEKRGCWIKLGGDKEFQTITFKVDDGVISFPMTVKGKRAEAEGVFTKVELTKEQAVARAQHEAEENKRPFDPKSVTGPTTVYLLKGVGAVVR